MDFVYTAYIRLPLPHPVLPATMQGATVRSIIPFCGENNILPAMLFLSVDQLDQARAAISRHGYSDFFPSPPEWAIVEAN